MDHSYEEPGGSCMETSDVNWKSSIRLERFQSDLSFFATQLSVDDEKEHKLATQSSALAQSNKGGCDLYYLYSLTQPDPLHRFDTSDLFLSASRQEEEAFLLEYNMDKTFIHAEGYKACPSILHSKTTLDEFFTKNTDNDESKVVLNTLLSMSSLLLEETDKTQSTMEDTPVLSSGTETVMKPSGPLRASTSFSLNVCKTNIPETSEQMVQRSAGGMAAHSEGSDEAFCNLPAKSAQESQCLRSKQLQHLSPSFNQLKLGSTCASSETMIEDVQPKRSTEVARYDLTEEEIASIPLDEDGHQTSIGSVSHVLGTCRPCAFSKSQNKKQCLNGIYCLFCHYKHPKRSKGARNQAKKAKAVEDERQANEVIATKPVKTAPRRPGIKSYLNQSTHKNRDRFKHLPFASVPSYKHSHEYFDQAQDYNNRGMSLHQQNYSPFFYNEVSPNHARMFYGQSWPKGQSMANDANSYVMMPPPPPQHQIRMPLSAQPPHRHHKFVPVRDSNNYLMMYQQYSSPYNYNFPWNK